MGEQKIRLERNNDFIDSISNPDLDFIAER